MGILLWVCESRSFSFILGYIYWYCIARNFYQVRKLSFLWIASVRRLIPVCTRNSETNGLTWAFGFFFSFDDIWAATFRQRGDYKLWRGYWHDGIFRIWGNDRYGNDWWLFWCRWAGGILIPVPLQRHSGFIHSASLRQYPNSEWILLTGNRYLLDRKLSISILN